MASTSDGRDSPGQSDGGAVGLQITPAVRRSTRILIIDDERTLCDSCANVLRLDGYNVTVCWRGDEALATVQRRGFDIVLVDLYMSGVSGMELLKACLSANPDTLVVIMTGNPSVQTSIEALRAGAWDYLPKPFSASHLEILIGRATHAVAVARETSELREELEKKHGHSERIKVLGMAPPFQRAIDLARRVASTNASVFITGESGSGKELIAQLIHENSRRSSRPLVAINCAALPEPLLESEMFGHVKGAFTGAIREKEGLLETANGGTLFLDEVTEMAAPIQAKLLRVIQDGVVRRVGGNGNAAVVDVRFIAATNRDPVEATEDGTLRKDLFYRLRVVPIVVPPLRDRVEDIPILARHFLAYYWARDRGPGETLPTFSRDAIRALQAFPWPGNVRELQNVIEHAVVLAEPGVELSPEQIPFMDDPVTSIAPASGRIEILDDTYHHARDRVLADFEKGYVTWLVGRAGGNMSKAARIAGVDRTTLYRLIEKHGMERDTILRAK
jgi:DNA-binding NtrC family response regulator